MSNIFLHKVKMFSRNGSRAIASIGLAPNNGIYTQIRLNPDPHGLACVDPAKTLILYSDPVIWSQTN